MQAWVEWFNWQRQTDASRQRAKDAQKARQRAETEVKEARAAIEQARAQHAEALGQIGMAKERIRAALARAEWAEHAAVADQRALLQALANMTQLEANRRPWPFSWLSSELRHWQDAQVADDVLPDLPSRFPESLEDQTAAVMKMIDAALTSATPATTAHAA